MSTVSNGRVRHSITTVLFILLMAVACNEWWPLPGDRPMNYSTRFTGPIGCPALATFIRRHAELLAQQGGGGAPAGTGRERLHVDITNHRHILTARHPRRLVNGLPHERTGSAFQKARGLTAGHLLICQTLADLG